MPATSPPCVPIKREKTVDNAAAIDTMTEAIGLLEAMTENARPWTVRTSGTDTYVECVTGEQWVAFYCGDDTHSATVGRWIALMDPIVGKVLIDVFEGCVERAENGDDVHPEWLAFAEVLVTKGGELFSR